MAEESKSKVKTRLLILGSGPSGLSAAIYAGRADLAPLVITGYEEGGQLTLTTLVENYPGFSDGVLGPDLMIEMRKQAEKFGAKFLPSKATSFAKLPNSHFLVSTDNAETIEAEAVIVATGASARFLGVPGEAEHVGRGVSTCATCDAYFYKGKSVAIIGGGDSACEEADLLTKFAERVFLIHRRSELRASKILQERVLANKKVSFIWDTVVEEILGGSERLSALKLRNVKTGETGELPVDGMFLAVGHVPNTEIFRGILDLDENGFLKTDKFTRTSLPGVFSAGDVSDPRYRQAIVSAGDGAKAALEAEKYLAAKTRPVTS
jgi:thioredoxin reductase (NADPH)